MRRRRHSPELPPQDARGITLSSSSEELATSAEMAMEAQKQEQWKMENRRRKHNYVPFIVNLLRLLAERGELASLVDAAKKRKKSRAS